jgi:hypothetical protein
VPRYDTDSFIELATKIHKGKYDYSNVVYTQCHVKVCIVCPEHGEFWQTPAGHLRNSGCYRCAKEKMFSDSQQRRKEEFINKAVEKHGDKFDYSLVEYVNSYTAVTIKCPQHGYFQTTPSRHLCKTYAGCSGCYKAGSNKEYALDLHEVNRRLSVGKELNPYIIFKGIVGEYENWTNLRVLLECERHGEYTQVANSYYRGMTCISCANEKRGARTRESYTETHEYATLYLLQIQNGNESYLKVGMTTLLDRRVDQISKDIPNARIEVVKHLTMPSGVVWDTEKRIHNSTLFSKYTPQEWFGGGTECYDISGLKSFTKVFDNLSEKLGGSA